MAFYLDALGGGASVQAAAPIAAEVTSVPMLDVVDVPGTPDGVRACHHRPPEGIGAAGPTVLQGGRASGVDADGLLPRGLRLHAVGHLRVGHRDLVPRPRICDMNDL